MNIMSYLTSPAFEDFADAPVGTDQLAHNQAAPGTEVPGVAPAGTEAPTDNLEIPEEVGPALVASADEAQLLPSWKTQVIRKPNKLPNKQCKKTHLSSNKPT